MLWFTEMGDGPAIHKYAKALLGTKSLPRLPQVREPPLLGFCQTFISAMRIRNSHGFARRADSREIDSDSQAFLILCESPCHRRFLRGVGTLHL